MNLGVSAHPIRANGHSPPGFAENTTCEGRFFSGILGMELAALPALTGARMDGLFVVNEGKLDRWLRVVLGIGLLSLVFAGPKTPWGYLGVVPLFTGIAGMCPLYRIFGFSTCPVK